jgi:hypothetical protein
MYGKTAGSHLHKKCPENEKMENSLPKCCNTWLKEGDRLHPANCWGCSLAKAELQRRMTLKSSSRIQKGRGFTSSYLKTGKSFATALQGDKHLHLGS